MKRDAEVARIRFALRLTETDLATLSAEDWQKLLMKVRNFLQGKAPEEDPQEVHELDFRFWTEREVTPVLLASVQGIVRYMLTRVVAENWRIDHGSSPLWGSVPMIAPSEVRVSANVNPSARTVEEFPLDVKIDQGLIRFDLLPGDFRSYLIASSVKEAFLFGLGMSLGRVDSSYLRRCPACPKIFFADDNRQEFCSSRCASRERNRRLRAAAEQKTEVGMPPPIFPGTGPFKRKRKRK